MGSPQRCRIVFKAQRHTILFLMINNLLSLLNFENIYLIANLGVIPFWLLLIILPHNQITNFFVQSAIVPLLLAGAYVYLSYNICTHKIYCQPGQIGLLCVTVLSLESLLVWSNRNSMCLDLKKT